MGIRTELEQQFEYDIVDEFADHFDIMTESMEPAIIALEHETGRIDKINELFRIFHNIKSAASFLKIERIHLLAELAEEMMERMRANEEEIDERVVDWLLLVSDQMRLWSSELLEDGTLGDIDPEILNVPKRD
ncbi:Hpt domain-containing protein [Hydrogenimonas urashimensis]|uniref:Hpt domain-containing protein n=1 Tax=Hydrogenimonas urashimensis TaxID=2740515 RepID=UPI00191556E1|nr:Hpt domain-containing protein [Hydrogenimonas urashimensis]